MGGARERQTDSEQPRRVWKVPRQTRGYLGAMWGFRSEFRKFAARQISIIFPQGRKGQ